MKILRILSGLLVFLLLPGCTSASVQKNDEPYTAQIFAMDTIMNLTIYGEHGQEMASQAAQRIEELEKLFSVTDEGSEIYTANHNSGAEIPLSMDTAVLLERALELCGSTSGALDVTILPILQAWGFTTGAYQIPTDLELAELLEQVDYRSVSLT